MLEEERTQDEFDEEGWDEEEEEWDEEALEEKARRSQAALRERFARYEDAAAWFQSKAEKAGLTEIAGNMERLRLRLRQGPVRLLIVGMSCSGKSTLVNALAGDFVAPEGGTATSCIPLWVSGRDPEQGGKNTRFQKLTLKDGELSGKPCNMVVALNQLCHAPGQDADTPEGMKAVTAETPGGFLWDSGLTLVDTPGLGQQVSDDAWTEEAIAMGAELLLIAHGANEKILGTEFQSLFPGGQRDLGLDMQRDLFLLGNNIHSTKQGVCQTLGKLVADWGIKAEKHFYWINVWEQRLRIGCYRYYQWFPDGATDEADSLKKEQDDQDSWRLLQAARAEALASGGGDEAETACFARLQTQKYMEEAPSEEQREIIRQAGPMRVKWARESREDMRKLCRDLTARSRELYNSPKRICDPIELCLREARYYLTADYHERIKSLETRLWEETQGLTREELREHMDADAQEELRALDELPAKLEERKAQVAGQMEQMESGILQAQEAYRTHLREGAWKRCGQAALAEKINSLPLKDSALKEDNWEEALVRPVRKMYWIAREDARTALLDGSLPAGLDEEVSNTLDGQRQRELLMQIEDALYLAGEVCPELENPQRFAMPEFYRPCGVGAFRSAEGGPIGDSADKLAEELRENLIKVKKRLWPEPAETAEKPPSLLGKLTKGTIQALGNLLLPNTERTVRNALKQIDADIAADVAAYVNNCIQARTDGELETLRTARRKLEDVCVRLGPLCAEKADRLLEDVRKGIYRRRRVDETAQLSRELADFIRQIKIKYPELLP